MPNCNCKICQVPPRVWKARRFIGQGYNQYGQATEGKYYCDWQTAIDLENELIQAKAEIKKLLKQ